MGADDDDKENYEPADDICTKCNCTSVNETLENGEDGKLFTLDCSMKSHERLFADWPEEMGANHTGSLIKLFACEKLANCVLVRHGTRLHHVAQQY